MNRVVLITGSTRGIGLETAKEFLKNGDKVVIFCRHPEHTAKALEELKDFNQNQILATTGDVSHEEDVSKIIKKTLDQFKKIDILVNNAGKAIYKPIENTTAEEWEDIMHTNLKGYFLFIKEIIPMMKARDGGTIINVSSGLGERGAANYGPYSASKFGVIGLTEVIADETDKTGIKVYAVLPGAVATKLHLDMHPWENPEDMMKPEKVAKVIFEIAEGEITTGSRIPIY